jgi:hypothetical protein
MELNELQILKRKSSTRHHGVTVTSASVSRSTRKEGSTITTGSENSVLGSETMDGSVLQTKSDHATAFAFLHQQIQSKVFDEVIAIVAKRLSIQGVKKRIASTISNAATSSE